MPANPNDEFELKYRRMVALNLDRMELFGVTIDEASRKYSLATAYVALSARSNGRLHRVDDLLGETRETCTSRQCGRRKKYVPSVDSGEGCTAVL